MGENRHNVGLDVLRLWACLEVVLSHFWFVATPPPPVVWTLMAMKRYAVPVFLVLSFFLAAEKFAAPPAGWAKARLKRLVVPHVVWGTVFALLATGATWKDWLLQLATGTVTAVSPQFWFQTAMIVLTAAFAFALPRIRRERLVPTLLIVFAVATVLQYTGVNFLLFDWMTYETKHPYGRVVECLPAATAAMVVGLNRARMDALKGFDRILTVALMAGLWYFFLYADVLARPKGFYYQGLQGVAVALPLLVGAYLMPTGWIPAKVAASISYLAKFCMGVYFVHYFVGRQLHALGLTTDIGRDAKTTFGGALVVLAVSWVVCWLLSRIRVRWVQGLLV